MADDSIENAESHSSEDNFVDAVRPITMSDLLTSLKKMKDSKTVMTAKTLNYDME